MGTGFLEVVTTTALGGLPIAGAKITVFSGDEILYSLVTNESGITETVALEAPPKALTLDVNFEGVPYSVCDVKAEAEGFVTVKIHDVEILDTETSILPIHMSPALEEGEAVDLYTPEHNLVSNEERRMDVPPEMNIPANTRVLSEVIIPEFITVHLGRPDRVARNVRVPFTYYIKNCASHEIFGTWPPASLEANIYCIISLTLNRIFTEWYRARGFNFDITNSTQLDCG
ncbi:MAG: carboxypeptidase-like regulatory domain-containing protein [Defluviitaleaceae bacterium]|nr:carboxypeptidase-like regulatory domain-containing protein [Defluviitaleaceae bacterium]